jgi:hypothetical protein
MSVGNYPPGMSGSDWDHVNGECLIDDDECPECGAEMEDLDGVIYCPYCSHVET